MARRRKKLSSHAPDSYKKGYRAGVVQRRKCNRQKDPLDRKYCPCEDLAAEALGMDYASEFRRAQYDATMDGIKDGCALVMKWWTKRRKVRRPRG